MIFFSVTPIISAFLKSVTFAVNGEVNINTSGVLTCVGGVDSQCVRACVRLATSSCTSRLLISCEKPNEANFNKVAE